MNYCFLDLETTGLDAKKDSILEISFLVKNEQGEILEEFDEVIIPDRSPLTRYITHITGITEKEVSERGKSFSTLVPLIQEKIGNAVIVGHNIDFDINFLQENGIVLDTNQRIDTHEIARIVLINEESYSLEILSEKYKFSHENAHRAMSDVKACAELLEFLQERIEKLPPEFLKNIRPILEQKTEWTAKQFFLHAKGDSHFSFQKKSLPTPSRTNDFEIKEEWIDSLSPLHSLFIAEGDSTLSSDALLSFAQKLITKGKKILIVSPKLSFFPEIKKFPIPEVLLDPEQLQKFLEHRETLGNAETVFYLQAQLRHFLGLRGVDQFDIFAHQRTFWKDICLSSETNPLFQEIIQERENEDILIISPSAFFRLHTLPIFQNRILLIDETESFASTLLFAPADEVSVVNFLEDEETSVAVQFFVKNVCQNIVEPQLQHALTPFPEKILLSSSQTFPQLAENALQVSSHETFQKIASFLSSPSGEAIRWIKYEPVTSNVVFGTWQPGDWRELKNTLGSFSKVFFHRTEEKRIKEFLRVFVGVEKGTFIVDKKLSLNKKLVVPERLESANDPQFNAFCAEKIIELAKERLSEEHWLALNFSSLETLKKIFSVVSEHFIENEDVLILGEKASGGDSKLFELLKRASFNKKKGILFTQKLIAPEVAILPIQTLLVQKFPFPPPHPLLKELEAVMKRSGQNFWGTWIVPQVTANLSRRVSSYPQAKEIIWLDPRENAVWGKEILKGLF